MAKKDPKVYESDISRFTFDDMNFNKHTKRGMEMLRRSVSNNGFGRSIVVDKDDRIICGNGIVETAQGLDKTKVRVIETTGDELVVVKRTDMTLDSKAGREMALADNTSAAVDLDLDEDLLRQAQVQYDIDMEAFGLDLDAFDDEEEDGETGAPTGEAQEDDYDEDVDKAPAKTVTGDLWQVGQHRVICGDSTSREVIERLLDGEQVNLYLTDPPYNVAYQKGDHDKIANDDMDSASFKEFLKGAFGAAFDFIAPGAAFYVWYALSEHTNFNQALADIGFKISEYLIWVKNGFVLGRHDYHYRHEPCVYGWKPGAAHKWYGDRSQSTVLEFPKPQKSVDHPTMKPVPLFAYQMENSSKAGDIVLDSFGGSGTTIIAAEQLGRKARLCELSEHYVDVQLDRYIKLVGSDKDVFLINPDGSKTPYGEVSADRV